MISVDVYVPDTSAIVENPEALDRLLQPGNMVILLHQVLEELGRLQASRVKSEGVRMAARAATRKILAYRDAALIHHHPESFLSGGAALDSYALTPTGGVLAWEPPPTPPTCHPSGCRWRRSLPTIFRSWVPPLPAAGCLMATIRIPMPTMRR